MKRQSVTLAAFARGWLLEMERHDATISKRTRTLYARNLTLHVLPVLGKRPIASLTRQDIRSALVTLLDRGVGRGAVWNGYIALSSCLSQAVALGLLETNPASRATKKLFLRRPSNVRALTRAELSRFLAATELTEPTWRDFVLTLALTGLRVSEALALTPDDVDRENRVLAIRRQWIMGEIDLPKGRRKRAVRIPRHLAELLHQRAAALPGHTWLFQRPGKEEPWHPSSVRHVLERISASAGLRRVTPHQFRHTWATLMLEETQDLVFVQRGLGHADIGLTADLYGKAAQPKHDDALERLADLGKGRHAGVLFAKRQPGEVLH